MARDSGSDDLNGSPAKRRHAKAITSRIIPAIPLAFEKKRVQKQQQMQMSEPESIPETVSTPARQSTPAPEVEEKHEEVVVGVHDQTLSEGRYELETMTPPMEDGGQGGSGSADIESVVEQGQGVDHKSVSHDASSNEETSHIAMPMPSHDQSPVIHPAFYPLRPLSTTSTSIHVEPPTTAIPMPRPRVYGGDLIFGGYRDSANSSPIPPTLPAGPPAFQNPVPGQASHGPAMIPLYPAGLDFNTTATFSSPYVPGPNGVNGPRHMYNQLPPNVNHAPPFPTGYHSFPTRPRVLEEDQYPPRYPAGPPRMNSYFPAIPDPARLPYPGDAMQMMQPSTMPTQKGHQAGDEQPFRRPSNQYLPSLQEDNASMVQYVHGQFGKPDFADYMIHISHARYLFQTATIPAHGLILARSPKLQSLMRMQQGDYQNPQTSPTFLHIVCSDKFLGHDIAFMTALRRLYGGPPPDRDFVMRLAIPAGTNPSTGINQEIMRFALAYAASGHFLQIDEIITYAIELAASNLTWETVSSALGFALEGGLSPSFTQFEATTTSTEDKASNSSYDETPNKFESPGSAPTYGIYSDRMLHRVIGFLLHNCPPQFHFFAAASQLYDFPHLPAAGEPKQPPMPSGSKFSQIRFGEMVTQNGYEAPDVATSAISSILISLPFLVLKYVLESHILGDRLGWNRLAEVALAVIKERGNRRRRALDNRNGAQPQSAIEERLWHNTKWIETAEPVEGTPLGLRLARHAIGIETPESGSSKGPE